MKYNIITFLRMIFISSLATTLVIAICFEMLLIEPGALVGNDLLNYWMGIVGVAMILILIPLALKLMKFKKVKEAVATSEQAYQQWSVIRLSLLSAPLVYNVLAYYMFGCEPSFGYMALMVVVAHLFVWPSRDRMIYERELNDTQVEQ